PASLTSTFDSESAVRCMQSVDKGLRSRRRLFSKERHCDDGGKTGRHPKNAAGKISDIEPTDPGGEGICCASRDIRKPLRVGQHLLYIREKLSVHGVQQ